MKTLERLHYHTADHSRKLGERVVNWTIHEPEEKTTNEVALVVPGIMAKRRLYNPYAQHLAERGVTTVTMAHEGASPLCTDEVLMVADELAMSGQKPIRLVGHSLGGMHATLAAVKRPDIMSGLLLVQSAGYGGVYPHHFAASLLDRPDNQHIPDELKAIVDGIDYFRGSHPDQLLRTAVMASRRRVIEEAKTIEGHIEKDAIICPHDRLIRPDKLKNGLARAGVSWYDLELDDGVIAGHNAIMYLSDESAELTHSIMTTGGFGLAA